jgi:hypothetical protein
MKIKAAVTGECGAICAIDWRVVSDRRNTCFERQGGVAHSVVTAMVRAKGTKWVRSPIKPCARRTMKTAINDSVKAVELLPRGGPRTS